MSKRFVYIILFTFCIFKLQAQIPVPGKGYVVRMIIIDGDTIPFIGLPETTVKGKRPTDVERKRFLRLVHNIKKAYPYAKMAGERLAYYDSILAKTPSEKERKKIMQKAEVDIKNEFESELKKLTFSQGRILIKLIDRETGSTSYALVQDLRGNFRAFFYQSFARIFGFNLKTKYNPYENPEDFEIEQIILYIQTGLL